MNACGWEIKERSVLWEGIARRLTSLKQGVIHHPRQVGEGEALHVLAKKTAELEDGDIDFADLKRVRVRVNGVDVFPYVLIVDPWSVYYDPDLDTIPKSVTCLGLFHKNEDLRRVLDEEWRNFNF